MTVLTDDLSEVLEMAAHANQAPGAAMSLIVDGREETATYGVASLDTHARITPETRFHIGSSAKMLTAALVGAAVDRGQLGLHDPIARYLPGVRPDPRITVFHLLTHTGGFDGDVLFDTGVGEDAIAVYVRRLADVPQADEPGRRHAYCNAGFSILARICELIFDMSWDEAMRTVITGPCGMEGFIGGPHALPDDAPHAWGHAPGPDGPHQPLAPLSHRFLSPAGGGPMATAKDMAAFAAMILRGGVSRTGAQVLSADWVGRMKTRWVEGPAPTFASAWGLGVMLYDWTGGVSLYGHDGVVPGQNFFLRLHDPSRSAIIIMINGGVADAVADDVFQTVYAPIVGGSPPRPPAPIVMEVGELQRFNGVYSGPSAHITVATKQNKLSLHCVLTQTDVNPSATIDVELTPIDSDLFLSASPNCRGPLMQRFQDFDDAGRPHVLNFRGRVFHRHPDGEKTV